MEARTVIDHGPECHDEGVRGFGEMSPGGVVFTGIAPGKNEMKEGRPFTGPSGQLLNAILKGTHSLPREAVYCTNLICWWKDDPTPNEQVPCRQRLEEELALLRPKLLVLVGRLAHEALSPEGHRGIGSARGAVLWDKARGCYVMSTYHPAAVLRLGPSLAFLYDIWRDLAKIPKILMWPTDGSISHVDYTVMTTHDEAVYHLNQLAELASLDIETDSRKIEATGDAEIDVFTDELLCYATSSTYIPRYARGARDWTFVFPRYVADTIDYKTEWPQRQWAFQNGMFDCQGMKRYYDLNLEITHDTMLLSYDLDERQGVHGLKSLAREYCGAGWYEVEHRLKSYMADLDTLRLHEYNAKDAAYTLRLLIDELGPRVWGKGIERPYKEILIPLANVMKDVMYRGIKIDKGEMLLLLTDWVPRWEEGNGELVKLALDLGWRQAVIERRVKADKGGNESFNLNSSVQKAALIYDVLGLPMTDLGRTTRREALEELEEEFPDHPFLKPFMDWTRLNHMLGSYCLGIDDDIKKDGLIHPTVMPHAQTSGRISYTKPPLQTMPRADVVGSDLGRVRNLIVPHNKDTHVIIEVDYAGSEIWVAYALSGDVNLYRDLTSGDFHRRVASAIFRIPSEEVTDFDRRRAKPVTFGIFYGRGKKALARSELQTTPYLAGRYIEQFFKTYRQYRQWMLNTEKTLKRTGKVVSMTGRERRFRWLKHRDAHRMVRQALNFPIQTLSNERTLKAAIDLHHPLRALDSYLLWSSHDSLIMEVSKRHLHEVVKLIHAEMTKPMWELPEMPIEWKMGRSLGRAKPTTMEALLAS